MKFTTTAAVLAEALTTARAAVPGRPTMSAYSGVLLAVRGNELSVTGSDGATTISALASVAGEADGQALLLPMPIGSYLGTLGPAVAVTVSTDADAGDVQVSADGGAPYRFRQIATTFPQPAATRAGLVSARLSGLAAALAAIRVSVKKDEPGVQLVSDDRDVVLHSTDFFRLTRATLPGAGFGEFTGVVPLPVLEQLARHEVTHVFTDAKGRLIRCSGPKVTVTARLMNIPFPNAAGVLDAPQEHTVQVPVEPLRRALVRLDAVAEKAPLVVRIDADEVELSADNLDLGSGSERVALPAPSAETVEFAVNLRYLLDAVTCHDGAEQVTFAWTDPLKPLHVRSTGPVPVSVVVMPMRVDRPSGA